jgi:hypothetical protein
LSCPHARPRVFFLRPCGPPVGTRPLQFLRSQTRARRPPGAIVRGLMVGCASDRNASLCPRVGFPGSNFEPQNSNSTRLGGALSQGCRVGAGEHVICSHGPVFAKMLISLDFLRINRCDNAAGYHQGNRTMANAAETFTPDLFGEIAEPLPTRRARTTNDPLSRNSRATARGRRIADVFRAYMQRMTDRSSFAQTDALAAAELKVDAEDVRARRAAGTASIDEVVKAERLVRHAERKLGLDRPQQAAAKPKKTTFADRLRENAAARAAAGNS